MANGTNPARDTTTLEGRLVALEKRLYAMERAAGIRRASIGEGGLTVEDGGNITIDGGNLRVLNGGLITARSNNGNTIFSAGGDDPVLTVRNANDTPAVLQTDKGGWGLSRPNFPVSLYPFRWNGPGAAPTYEFHANTNDGSTRRVLWRAAIPLFWPRLEYWTTLNHDLTGDTTGEWGIEVAITSANDTGVGSGVIVASNMITEQANNAPFNGTLELNTNLIDNNGGVGTVGVIRLWGKRTEGDGNNVVGITPLGLWFKGSA